MTDFLNIDQYFNKTTMYSNRNNSLMSPSLNMNFPMINNMFNPMNNNMNQMMLFINQMMNCYNNNSMNENIINMNNQQIIILHNCALLDNNIMIKNMHNNLIDEINYFESMINNKENDNDKKLIEKKIEELTIKEKLIRFLKFISFMNKVSESEENLKGSKIFINYYNIVKFVLYLDLNLKIKELISYIFWKIFYSFKYDLEFKRFHKNETTEYIIQHPKKFQIIIILLDIQTFYFWNLKINLFQYLKIKQQMK